MLTRHLRSAPVNPMTSTSPQHFVSDKLTPLTSNRRRWTVVGLLFAASLINYLDRSAISFALPSISRDLHLLPATKGLLLSSFFWSYALLQIPIGWCSDRFNLYWLYAGAFTIWSVAQGLTGLAAGLSTLIAFRVILGLGESIYLPGGTKIVSVLFSGKERGLPSGLFNCGTRMGLVFGGILIPWLLVRFGWRQSFLILGFVALLWLIPWFLAFPPRLPTRIASSGAKRTAGEHLRHALTNRNLLGICLGFFCFDYYWYVLVTWLPDYLVTARHLSIVNAGFFASAAFLIFGVSEPIGGLIADTLIERGWNETRTRKGIVTIAFLCGLFLIAAIRTTDTRLALALLMGACLAGLATGNLIVILQCCAPPEHVGVWTGTENFAGNLAGVVAPLAVGLLIKSSGSYIPGFTVGSIVLLVGILAYGFIVGELKTQTAEVIR
jgi:ACS family D-galactonate transporter-like MFS transporter